MQWSLNAKTSMTLSGRNRLEYIGNRSKTIVSSPLLIGTAYILMSSWEQRKDFASPLLLTDVTSLWLRHLVCTTEEHLPDLLEPVKQRLSRILEEL